MHKRLTSPSCPSVPPPPPPAHLQGGSELCLRHRLTPCFFIKIQSRIELPRQIVQLPLSCIHVAQGLCPALRHGRRSALRLKRLHSQLHRCLLLHGEENAIKPPSLCFGQASRRLWTQVLTPTNERCAAIGLGSQKLCHHRPCWRRRSAAAAEADWSKSCFGQERLSKEPLPVLSALTHLSQDRNTAGMAVAAPWEQLAQHADLTATVSPFFDSCCLPPCAPLFDLSKRSKKARYICAGCGMPGHRRRQRRHTSCRPG